jgi:hypothetical protein
MSEAIVTKNSGEVAQFSDSGTIIRQRPGLGTAIGVNYSKIVQPDHFKFAFPVGATKSQVNERLRNPPSTDGVPIGSTLPANPITTNQARPDVSKPVTMNDKLKG